VRNGGDADIEQNNTIQHDTTRIRVMTSHEVGIVRELVESLIIAINGVLRLVKADIDFGKEEVCQDHRLVFDGGEKLTLSITMHAKAIVAKTQASYPLKGGRDRERRRIERRREGREKRSVMKE
jgi:hypothetical protein